MSLSLIFVIIASASFVGIPRLLKVFVSSVKLDPSKELIEKSLAFILKPMQKQNNQSFMSNLKMDDQSRVVMKFEEKRQLLKAILDRKEQLFGPNAAKMKPTVKQQLWDDTISAFKRACPESTAELSAGYVRGIFWQNLRKRTLAKRERMQTDQNVKLDELDDLVTQILGDKISSPPLSRNQTPMNNNYSNLTELFPFLNESLYSQLNNGNGINLENIGLNGLQFGNNDNSGQQSPEQSNQSTDEWKMDGQADIQAESTSLAPPPFKKRKVVLDY
jgi:hypothetical protein